MQKIVLVTGASSGFGRMIATDLAREGHVAYASMRDIAGISSADCRVVGLMPHPEHATEPLTGPSDDGLGLFYSALDAVLV